VLRDSADGSCSAAVWFFKSSANDIDSAEPPFAFGESPSLRVSKKDDDMKLNSLLIFG